VVNGSSLLCRSASIAVMLSFKGHSLSPLWWPKFPQRAHFTFLISTANGFTLPVAPLSSLHEHQKTESINSTSTYWQFLCWRRWIEE
jgi:hypothetical protein